MMVLDIVWTLVMTGSVVSLFLLAESWRRKFIMAAIYVKFVEQMVINEPHRWNAIESKFMIEQAEIAMTDPNPFWKFWGFDPKKEFSR